MTKKIEVFKDKNEWRRWVWGLLAETMPAKEKRESLILYLGGAEDLDRREATFRGFPDNNLILVENDAEISKKFRRQNKTVIQSDIKYVLRAWPVYPRIGAVIGDFCDGIDFGFANEFPWFIAMYATRGTIFVFNFQRGREKNFRLWTKTLGIKDIIHRGQMFAHIVFDEMAEVYYPRYATYKSSQGNLVFDSIVFWNRFREWEEIYKDDWEFGSIINRLIMNLSAEGEEGIELNDAVFTHIRKEHERAEFRETRRKLAAFFAHRTRRSRKEGEKGLKLWKG